MLFQANASLIQYTQKIIVTPSLACLALCQGLRLDSCSCVLFFFNGQRLEFVRLWSVLPHLHFCSVVLLVFVADSTLETDGIVVAVAVAVPVAVAGAGAVAVAGAVPGAVAVQEQ